MKELNKICLLVLLVLFAYSFTECKSDNNIEKDKETDEKTEISEEILKEDAEFIEMIEQLPVTLLVDYSPLDDLEHLLSGFGDLAPNLIVRCEVISRGETAVITVLSTFTNDDLTSENEDYVRTAIDCIRTPYEMRIKEAYHGTINKENDIITIVAPYGTIDGFVNRVSDYPIYSVGDEYILFFNVLRRFGELEYSLFYTPCSWVKLDSQGGTFEYGDLAASMYSKYKNNTNTLVKDLKKIIKNNNLSTEVESHGDIEAAVEFKRQKNNSQGVVGKDDYSIEEESGNEQ